MRSPVQILVLSLASTFLLSSCRFVVVNHDYLDNLVDSQKSETQSCAYNLNEGEQAQFGLLNSVNFKTALFEKEYNSALLEGILAANLASTINFVAKTDLALYKAGAIKTSGCSRDLYSSLATMPQDIAKKFKESEAAANASKGTLLGMYFPKDEKGLSGLPSTSKQPALIVRDNTSRWTLLHEFSHHLFKTREQEKGIVAKELEKELLDLQSASDKARFDPTTSLIVKAEKLTVLFSQYARVLDAVVVAYPLEEVAIEVMLKEYQAQGSLKFAPTHDNAYIAANLIKADELIGEGIDFGLNIVERAEKANRTDLVDELMVALDKLSARATQISEIYEKHAPKNVIPGDAQIVSQEHSDELTERCGHSMDFNEISESVRKLKDLKF